MSEGISKPYQSSKDFNWRKKKFPYGKAFHIADKRAITSILKIKKLKN